MSLQYACLFHTYFNTMLFIKDYGIWERGDKTNNGQPELNASSIGMAKVITQIFSAYLSKFQVVYMGGL